jgi:hypothetical protein
MRDPADGVTGGLAIQWVTRLAIWLLGVLLVGERGGRWGNWLVMSRPDPDPSEPSTTQPGQHSYHQKPNKREDDSAPALIITRPTNYSGNSLITITVIVVFYDT